MQITEVIGAQVTEATDIRATEVIGVHVTESTDVPATEVIGVHIKPVLNWANICFANLVRVIRRTLKKVRRI